MPELHGLTVAEAAERIHSRELSPVSLLQAFFDRIDLLEPSLEAWMYVDREGALGAAHRCEEEIAAGGYKGPLHGVPVAIKDIFHAEGMKTTAGSRVYEDFVAEYDSEVIARLRDAGAIIMGKTTTAEFAAADPPSTYYPWDRERTPGGSSTGSAVAVSTGMCPIAIGSQGSASTLRPAAYNGIVGLKATYSRVSLYGMLPYSFTGDHVGILAKNVEDSAIMLAVLAGHDPKEPSSSREKVADYRSAALSWSDPPRIGRLREYFDDNADEGVMEHTAQALQKLVAAGAVIEDVKLPASFATAHAAHGVLGRVHSASFHHDAFLEEPDKFGPGKRLQIEAGGLVPGVRYVQAQRMKREFRRDMEEIAAGYDVLLTPATPAPSPKTRAATGDRRFQIAWSYSGLPTIAIPSGIHPIGLPLGLQLIAPGFAEEQLLGAAHWCEQVLNVSLKPPLPVAVS
jgi:aspartyl-tRNA(Asn)/glutamyl-tRNA(Gln) amidotransferase subunit A